MSEPTKAMQAEAKRIIREQWGNTFDGYPTEVGAFARGMAHAADLIETDLANVSPVPLLVMAPSSEAAKGIKGGIRYMRARILNGDWLTVERYDVVIPVGLNHICDVRVTIAGNPNPPTEEEIAAEIAALLRGPGKVPYTEEGFKALAAAVERRPDVVTGSVTVTPLKERDVLP